MVAGDSPFGPWWPKVRIFFLLHDVLRHEMTNQSNEWMKKRVYKQMFFLPTAWLPFICWTELLHGWTELLHIRIGQIELQPWIGSLGWQCLFVSLTLGNVIAAKRGLRKRKRLHNMWRAYVQGPVIPLKAAYQILSYFLTLTADGGRSLLVNPEKQRDKMWKRWLDSKKKALY